MARLWQGPPVRALLDEQSTDTAENAGEALARARMLDVAEPVVASSWCHLPPAVLRITEGADLATSGSDTSDPGAAIALSLTSGTSFGTCRALLARVERVGSYPEWIARSCLTTFAISLGGPVPCACTSSNH
jgi:hypothetical protein